MGIFLLTELEQQNTIPDRYLTHYIDYPSLDLEKSSDSWKLFSEGYEYSSEIDWMQIAAKYSLTPGQIESALRSVTEIAKFRNLQITKDLISTVVFRENAVRLSVLSDKIDLVYTWDDLMLNETSKNMLMDACNRIKHRYTVEIEWSGKFAYGNGISILLYGPPGTGKTMSAQVIANELGLPLCRVKLSQIISKYIGETSKNINRVFDEAKKSNVILFFDEADALFAKRTDINNSNDRHANAETSFLLQKIEDYPGVSILASNLSHTFDEAFRRRITYMVNIHIPKVEQRLAIWKRCIPTKAPLADDVDLDFLAKELEISGSIIKSAALQATYFAADENDSINMKHLVRAIFLELRKLGMNDPHFLKKYLN